MNRREQQRHVPFVCPGCGSPLGHVFQTREWQGAIRRKRRCSGDPAHVVETRETVAAQKPPTSGRESEHVGGMRVR